MNGQGRRMGWRVWLAAAGAVWAGLAGAAEWQVRPYPVIATGPTGSAMEPETPIVIVGARNGRFSGAVAVSSDAPIAGLRATVEPAARPGAAGRIPPCSSEHVQVRFAQGWDAVARWQPPGLDILLETPPATVAVRGSRATIGVWVTIDVPADAPAGVFHGLLRLEAEGAEARPVPIELHVADWTIPDAGDWRTWVELIQSPDTLALEYEVPLWSERHWELIARSFRLIRPSGSRVVYVPLLSETNQGNAESMVRWVRGRDGSLRPDFSIMERYLDVAQANLGSLTMVVFYAWDAYLAGGSSRPTVDENAPAYSQQQQRLAQRRWDERQEGLTVTIVDEATGEAEGGRLPLYADPSSRERWAPVYAELRARMRRRGLEEAMALGIVTDVSPSREDGAFLREVSGGLPWIVHRHPGGTRGRPDATLHGSPIAYEAHVYNIVYQVNPDRGREYGWRIPELRAFFGRHGIPNGPPLRVRLLPEFNITGRQRGVGRVGADFWFVMRDRRGRRSGAAYARYPKNNWRNLDIDSWVLAPGPDGAVSTARLENLVEGLQECEARIFIESILLDEAQRARIGEDLATRAQAVLDARQLAMWRTVWANEEHLARLGTLGDVGNARNAPEAIWQALGRAGVRLPGYWDGEARQMRTEMEREGIAWFIDSDWKERNLQLYQAAGAIARRLR